MNKEITVQNLKNILESNEQISNEEKIALGKAIDKYEISSDPTKALLILKIILKLLGLGTKYFET